MKVTALTEPASSDGNCPWGRLRDCSSQLFYYCMWYGRHCSVICSGMHLIIESLGLALLEVICKICCKVLALTRCTYKENTARNWKAKIYCRKSPVKISTWYFDYPSFDRCYLTSLLCFIYRYTLKLNNHHKSKFWKNIYIYTDLIKFFFHSVFEYI